MSFQVVTASALAAFTLFMAAALITVGAPQATASAPAVAAAQAPQSNG